MGNILTWVIGWLCMNKGEVSRLPVGRKVDILPAEVLGMLVQPSVFKTDVGREKRLGGVRFPCISAKPSFYFGSPFLTSCDQEGLSPTCWMPSSIISR